ncbi:MAG: ATP-binding cassette domain-containing protein [Acutalibacteraceae bacterium]
MEYVLQSNNLTKTYSGVHVVDHVNLNVRKGEIYGFVGKNGAGKTTFLRLILGMAVPSEGSFTLFGNDDVVSGRKKIGGLIESPALYNNMSAADNLSIIADLANADVKKNAEILDLVGLADTGRKKAKDFSLGMRQRLGIGMALVGDPEFIVLDEPINGLDPTGIIEVRELILKLNKEYRKTILISSHILDELNKVATCYGIISRGRLVEEITANEVIARCSNGVLIKTDNSKKAKEILSKLLPNADIVFTADDTLLIRAEIENTGTLTKALFENDVIVESITKETNSMEKYFVSRMEGETV